MRVESSEHFRIRQYGDKRVRAKRTAGDDIDAAHLAQHHAALVARAERGRRLGVRVVHLRVESEAQNSCWVGDLCEARNRYLLNISV